MFITFLILFLLLHIFSLDSEIDYQYVISYLYYRTFFLHKTGTWSGSKMQRVSALVSCEWLSRILSPQTQYLRVLDGTWYMPSSGMDPKLEFAKKHIPGAEQFSIDDCTLPHSPFSNTLPTPEFFAEYVGERGICNNTHVVVYDNHPQLGVFAAARVWWLFRVFGHNAVSVLDGGLPLWEKAGHPLCSSTAPSEVEKKEFKAELQPNLVKRFSDMTGNLNTNKFQVMDARSKARFLGKVPEPREGTCIYYCIL